MQISWEDVAKHTNGDMVGGQLYARIDGALVLLGTKRGPQFDFTEDGEKIAREIANQKRPPGKRVQLKLSDEAGAGDAVT